MPDLPEKPLSVVIPAYNEAETVESVINTVLNTPLVGEVVVVNDFSTDNTAEIVKKIADQNPNVKFFSHEYNQGKGAALRTGFQQATLPFVIVQDADLEYDERVVRPLIDDKCDVSYGSRYLKNNPRRVLRFWHTMGNKFLTTLSNMATNLHVTDMETCYKAFKREVIQSIEIEENRFGFEPEITRRQAYWLERRCQSHLVYFQVWNLET